MSDFKNQSPWGTPPGGGGNGDGFRRTLACNMDVEYDPIRNRSAS